MTLDAQSTAPVREGDVIDGKYRIDRILGEGGMGVVLAVTHLGLQQRFAMKFLLPGVVQVPALVERFTREAQAAVKIHSEHVARVTDVGVLPSGAPYMLMEYLEGEDLAAVLKAHTSLPVQDAVGFTLEALEAIAEAHSLGIVHRDLKPGNLFLARRPGRRSIVKVLDFGISKVSSTATRPALTSSGALIGSPGYMSPEQMMSADTVDAATDIWAIGVVLYEMLTGRRPFEAETMPELVATVLAKPHVPVIALRPDIPQAVSEAIDCCLAKERTHRFQNVSQLAIALAPFAPPHAAASVERIAGILQGNAAGMVAYSVPPPAAGSSVKSAGPGTFSPTSGGAVPMKSNAPVFAIAALVFLVLLGGGSAVAWKVTRRASTGPSPSASVAVSPSTTPSSTVSAMSPDPIPSGSQVSAPPAVVDAGPSNALGNTAHTGRHNGVAPAASSAQPAASAPKCRRVSYYDNMGEEHFRMEGVCP